MALAWRATTRIKHGSRLAYTPGDIVPDENVELHNYDTKGLVEQVEVVQGDISRADGVSLITKTQLAAALASLDPNPWAPDTARIQNIHAHTRNPARGLFVQRIGEKYCLGYSADPGWFRHSLPLVTGSGADGPFGAGGVHMLRGVDHVAAQTAVAYATAAPTETGTWADSTSGSWTWRRTNTTGDFSTWTAPAASTSLGLTVARHSSAGGVAKVAINGDFTAATSLPTAQKLVDTGRIDAAMLTTGGGGLDPTHRCLLTYAVTTQGDVRVLLADNLTPGAHVVRVEHSGAYRVGSPATADRRIAIQGFASATDTAPNPTTTNLFAGAALSDTTSAWEIATSFAPGGVGSGTFLGTYHGNHTETTATISIDGAAPAAASTVLADGATVLAGQSVVIKTTGTLVHPVAGHVADIETTYTLDVAGLRINPKITWRAAGSVKAAYAMMPVSGPRLPDGFTHGTTSRRASVPTQVPTTIPHDADYGSSKAPAALMWGTAWVAVHHVQDWTTWTSGGVDTRGTVIEGRNLDPTTSLLKAYNPRTKSTTGESVANGTVHAYTAQTRFARRGTADPSTY